MGLSESDGKHTQILTYITYVGGTIGSLALLLTLVGFGKFRDVVQLPETIVANLAFALLAGMLLFVAAGAPSTHAEGGTSTGCAITAGFLHYLFLSVWTWQVAEAWHLTEQFVSVFNAKETIWPFVAVGWGAPLLFVIPSASVWPEAYGSETVCWINPSKETPAIWFFVGPALLCLLVCIGSIIRIMRSVSDTTKSRWVQVKAFVTFGSVLGLTQIFGALMAIDAENVVFAYLFTIGLSSQGVLIMYFHLFRKEKFQEEWKTVKLFSSSSNSKGKLNLSRIKSKVRSNNSNGVDNGNSIIAEGLSITGKEEGAVSPNPLFMEF